MPVIINGLYSFAVVRVRKDERTRENARREKKYVLVVRDAAAMSFALSFGGECFFGWFFFIIYTKYRTIETREKKEEEEEEQVFLLKLCSFTVIAMTNEEEKFQRGLKQKKSITWRIFVSIGEQSKEETTDWEGWEMRSNSRHCTPRDPVCIVARCQEPMDPKRTKSDEENFGWRDDAHPDWDRKEENKSIAELWKLSTPVTSYFAECPDRWHRWNWCSGDKFSL